MYAYNSNRIPANLSNRNITFYENMLKKIWNRNN